MNRSRKSLHPDPVEFAMVPVAKVVFEWKRETDKRECLANAISNKDVESVIFIETNGEIPG